MWYSSSAYQIRPNFESPVPHFCSLKSSVSEDAKVLEFVFVFVFVLFVLAVVLVLRFSRLFVFALLLLVFPPMLANAITITTKPMPITPSAARPPRIHQMAFDFFGGGATPGVGDHCGCVGGGGGGGGAAEGRGGATSGESGR